MQVVASCTRTHTEITLVSDWLSSLSFWSQVPPLQPGLPRLPHPQAVLYEPHRTYVAVIASDGDNMQVLACRTAGTTSWLPSCCCMSRPCSAVSPCYSPDGRCPAQQLAARCLSDELRTLLSVMASGTVACALVS